MSLKPFSIPILILFITVLAACQTAPVTVPTLPEDPITISVEQSESEWIPGSAQGLSVHLGDISHGQVMLSIQDSENHVVVDGRSLRRGDVVAFEMGTRRHYFQLMELDETGALKMSKLRGPTVVSRQAAPTVYEHVAGPYVLDPDYLRRANHLLEGHAEGYDIGPEKSFDIDSELDFAIVEFLMRRKLGFTE